MTIKDKLFFSFLGFKEQFLILLGHYFVLRYCRIGFKVTTTDPLKQLKRTKLSGVYLRVPCVGSIITSFRVLRLRAVLEKGSLPSLEKFLQEFVLNKAVRKGDGQLAVFDALINDDFATGKERQILATDNIARPVDDKICKILNK